MSTEDKTKGLWFSIQIAEDEFIAFVSAEALRIHFNALSVMGRHLLSAYQDNQQVIDEVALHKFLSGSARPIKLCVGDFHKRDDFTDINDKPSFNT